VKKEIIKEEINNYFIYIQNNYHFLNIFVISLKKFLKAVNIFKGTEFSSVVIFFFTSSTSFLQGQFHSRREKYPLIRYQKIRWLNYFYSTVFAQISISSLPVQSGKPQYCTAGAHCSLLEMLALPEKCALTIFLQPQDRKLY
jgi:hypothetical protein